MSIPGSVNPLLLGAAASIADDGYLIERSLRFNSADSAYLSRTPSVSGNRKTWTWAGWVKRSGFGSADLFVGDQSSGGTRRITGVRITSDAIRIANALVGTYNYAWTSTAVFRDPSAWYHIVAFFDSTEATTAAAARVWVNGVEVSLTYLTLSGSSYAQNDEGYVNAAGAHYIGAGLDSSGNLDSNLFFNGYLADIHFIDGQALDPTSFGFFDSNGIWQPKAYTGTYGTNGFQLKFEDNSSNTATTLGKDTSPNGNNWTPNNLSIGVAGNTSQNWSATVSIAGQTGFEATKAFDGDASSASSTYYFPGANGTGTFTFAQSVPYSTIKIWYGRNNGRVFVNGVDMVVGSTGYAELTQADLAAKGVSSPLVSIGLERTGAGNGAYLFGVEVNGSQLVDPAYSAVNDSLVDVPTNGAETDTGAGGEVRGNYCTWNPLSVIIANGAELSNGNLDAKLANARAFGTVAIPRSGKWYFEVTVNSIFNVSGFVNGGTIGLAKVGTSIWSGVNVENGVANDGGIWKNSALVQLLKNATAGDVYGIAYNADTLSLQIYRNGSSYGNSITLDDADYIATLSGNGNDLTNANNHTANFGQRPFATQAPSGFKALCTANLP
jgi:hypothetical protein